MTHEEIKAECESLGLTVQPTTAYGAGRSFSATNSLGVRVYWSTSLELGLLGLPRVLCQDGHYTHARSLKEIRFLTRVKPAG